MRTSRRSVGLGLPSLLALALAAGCDNPTTAPESDSPFETGGRVSAVPLADDITIYTDRAAWEAAVVAAGNTVSNLSFTGLTLGRVTQTTTNYGAFSLVVDQVSATSSSNPGINIFPDASCSLGTGDCHVFTFNMKDPTSLLDMPLTNQVVFPQPVVAFGGNFIQLGITAGSPGTVTGPVTLTFGTHAVVVNDHVDASGNGFVGLVATVPSTTVTFTFAKSGTLQNEIFDLYNPAYANAPAGPTPQDQIADLQAVVAASGINNGVVKKLQTKLTAALNAVNANQTATACTAMQDFISVVAAQGRKIPPATAATLTADAQAIRTNLGC